MSSTCQSDWLPHVTRIHFILLHLNRWKGALGSIIAFIGLVFILWRTQSYGTYLEDRRAGFEANAVRRIFHEEIRRIASWADYWVIKHKHLAQEKRSGNYHVPARYLTPIYNNFESDLKNLSAEEVSCIYALYGQIRLSTRQLLQQEVEGRNDIKRLGTSQIVEEDNFSLPVEHAQFFIETSTAIRYSSTKAHNAILKNHVDIGGYGFLEAIGLRRPNLPTGKMDLSGPDEAWWKSEVQM